MPNTRLCGSSSEEKISDGRDPKIWDCDSTLYDSYELVSFVHIIERKLMPFSPLARQPGLTLRALMDKDSDLGKLVRSNHAKLKETLGSHGLLTGYVDKFVEELQEYLIWPMLLILTYFGN